MSEGGCLAAEVGQVCGMANRAPSGRMFLHALISIALAALLVGAATLARAALGPKLGALSPFMLYVAAVLVAGLVRGPVCGALVMLGGGALGFTLFLNANGTAPDGSVVALMIFWGVSAPVLVTANELRVQLSRAMARLSAALERSDRIAS